METNRRTTTVTVTMATSAAVSRSPSIPISESVSGMFYLPATWAGTPLRYRGFLDTAEAYVIIKDASGNVVESTVAADGWFPVPAEVMAAKEFLIQSPSTADTGEVITVVLRT